MRRSTPSPTPWWGLKENVILGKLIPAGTGLEWPKLEAKAQAYSTVGYDSFDYDFGQGSGAIVPLDELISATTAEIEA
jgi:DNA-directed RNA polymerase subunit beta'